MATPGSGLVVDEERAFLAAGFGARLRAERLAAGLRQRDLSAATSITRQNISRFELGKTRPRASTVEVLARALRPGRSRVQAESLALELMAAAGSSLREDRGQRSRRRRRAVARYERTLERLERLQQDPAWLAPALSLVRDDPRPEDFTRAMFETWGRVQLLDELRKLPWPDQIAATARAYGETAEEAEDRLWDLYRAPGAPSPY